MKTLIAALSLLPTLIFAQEPSQPTQAQFPARIRRPAQAQESKEVLPENLLLKLTIKEKENTSEISAVVAATDFKIQSASPDNPSFSGTLTLEEDGTIFIRYALVQSVKETQGTNIVYRESGAQNSVRLRLDEPVQILKEGTRVVELSVTRVVGVKKGK